MRSDNTNSRRNFLKTAGAALVAASVPAAAAAQSNSARPNSGGNNLKQLVIFGGVSEPLPSLPGVFGQASFQFQMRANLDGSGGFGTISDPVFGVINSQIEFQSGRYDLNDIYVFQGTVRNSLDPNLVGKQATAKVKILPDDNCNVSLTIGDTPVQGLLLPAIQKVRDKNGL